MIRYLNKETERKLLADLFAILYENMASVTPFSQSRQEAQTEWTGCIGDAILQEKRQILLLFVDEELAGFCMYYINGEIFMIEELQIKGEYRSTVLAAELFRFFRRMLPVSARIMEAYADKRNHVSQNLMKKLGMEQVAEHDDGSYLLFRGSTDNILTR